MSNELYDIAIIGSGPGGYHAALRAASYGAKVALIEKDTRLGGTCLNRGCIPTKALYASAKMVDDMREKAELMGIQLNSEFTLRFDKAVARKNKVVQELTEGIAGLCKAKKVTVLKGFGSLISGNILSNFIIEVKGQDNVIIAAKRVIIASGSQPVVIPNFNIDHKKILDSNDVLHSDFNVLPKSAVIIGGGVIGCEFANIFAEFGVKITLIEYLDTILANEEKLIVKTLKKKMESLGIIIKEGVNVLNVSSTESGVRLTTIASKSLNGVNESEKSYFEAEMCLVSIGRQKYIDGLGLDKMNIKTERGGIKINHITMETNQPGIYAIGDCTGILMLAHFASYQGDIAVMNAMSSIGGFEGVYPEGANFSTVPATTFTIPPIGSVGLREKEAKEKFGDILIGRFMYSSSGKAKCMGEEEGFMMVIADKKTDKIVGASCIGESAAELISEISVAMRLGLTTTEMAAVIHSHPTLSEIVLEAIEDVHGLAIHKAAKRR